MNYLSLVGIAFVFLGIFMIHHSATLRLRQTVPWSRVLIDISGDDTLSKAVKAEADQWADGRQYTVRLDHGADGWNAAAVVVDHSDVVRTLQTRGSQTPIAAVQEVMRGLGLHRS